MQLNYKQKRKKFRAFSSHKLQREEEGKQISGEYPILFLLSFCDLLFFFVYIQLLKVHDMFHGFSFLFFVCFLEL